MSVNPLRRTAIQAAKAAGRIIQNDFRRAASSYRYKGPRDIVTPTDVRAEKIILNIIRKKFPEHSFYSEEYGKHYADSEYLWLIDPLDGTTNFTRKFPHLGVSLALVHKNKIVLGVIYNPLTKELFRAERGKGAYLNNRKISANSADKLIDAVIVMNRGSLRLENMRFAKLFHFLTPHAKSMRSLGSTAMDLCYVACGRFDAVLITNSQPHNYAAGLLIAEEAGANSTDFFGAKVEMKESDIVAANRKLHLKLIKLLRFLKMP